MAFLDQENQTPGNGSGSPEQEFHKAEKKEGGAVTRESPTDRVKQGPDESSNTAPETRVVRSKLKTLFIAASVLTLVAVAGYAAFTHYNGSPIKHLKKQARIKKDLAEREEAQIKFMIAAGHPAKQAADLVNGKIKPFYETEKSFRTTADFTLTIAQGKNTKDLLEYNAVPYEPNDDDLEPLTSKRANKSTHTIFLPKGTEVEIDPKGDHFFSSEVNWLLKTDNPQGAVRVFCPNPNGNGKLAFTIPYTAGPKPGTAPLAEKSVVKKKAEKKAAKKAKALPAVEKPEAKPEQEYKPVKLSDWKAFQGKEFITKRGVADVPYSQDNQYQFGSNKRYLPKGIRLKLIRVLGNEKDPNKEGIFKILQDTNNQDSEPDMFIKLRSDNLIKAGKLNDPQSSVTQIGPNTVAVRGKSGQVHQYLPKGHVPG